MVTIFRTLVTFLLIAGLAGSVMAAGTSSAPATPDSKEMIKTAERHLYNDQYDKALSLLQKAERKDPNNPDIHNLLGYTYRNLGDTDQAMKSYTKALELDPDHIGAHEYMGQLFLTLKQPEEAKRLLDRLESLCGNCSEYKKLKRGIDSYSG